MNSIASLCPRHFPDIVVKDSLTVEGDVVFRFVLIANQVLKFIKINKLNGLLSYSMKKACVY